MIEDIEQRLYHKSIEQRAYVRMYRIEYIEYAVLSILQKLQNIQTIQDRMQNVKYGIQSLQHVIDKYPIYSIQYTAHNVQCGVQNKVDGTRLDEKGEH